MAITISVLTVSFVPTAHADTTRQWATYYGGSQLDVANAVQFDGDEDVVVVGQTHSPTNIAGGTTPYDTTHGGAGDGFVAKFNFTGVRQWSTYFGGTGLDYFSATTVDDLDNVIAFGTTRSPGIATAGAPQTTLGGTQDALLVKFNKPGSLTLATYIGGSDVEEGLGVCVNSNGTIYAVGSRTVSNTTTGFITKIGGTPPNVMWTKYMGGASGTTIARGCAVDISGNIYVIGETNSTGIGIGADAHDTSYNLGTDAFLAKYNTSGMQLWLSYYGGTAQDRGHAITTDGTNVYIAGHTSSGNGGAARYLATAGAWSEVLTDDTDAFVAKFNVNGDRSWGTYFGETGYMGQSNLDSFSGISHHNGVLYLSGSTNSTGIATPDAHAPTYGGHQDAMFVAMDAANNDVYYATYIGGSGTAPSNQGLAVASTYAHAVVVGTTTSNADMTTPGAHDVSYGGGIDAFIAFFEMFAT